MGWNITEKEKTLKVEVEGRLVAAVAPELRDEVLSKMSDGTNASGRAEDCLRHHEGEPRLRDSADGG